MDYDLKIPILYQTCLDFARVIKRVPLWVAAKICEVKG
jgi:hypothetical protein